MYDHIEGILVSKQPTSLVVQTQGVGYLLHISFATYENSPSEGSNLQIFTYLHVREDQLTLYGFHCTDERRFFLKLISISGIGPTVGLRILSGHPLQQLIEAIQSGNIVYLSKIKGIGKKTAERIVLELSSALKDFSIVGEESVTLDFSNDQKDSVSALVTLGYSMKEAEKVVQKVLQINPGFGLDDIIKESLKLL